MMPKDLSDAFLLLGKSKENKKITKKQAIEMVEIFSFYLNQKKNKKIKNHFFDEFSLENAYKHSLELVKQTP